MNSIRKILKKYTTLPVQIKASVWFLICSFLQKGISMLTTPIFTRLLTTAEYGQYNVFNSWYGILTIFITLNLHYGVFSQGLVKFEEDRNVFCSTLQGLSLTLTLLWTGIYFLFCPYWNALFSLSTVQMLAILVMSWASTAFGYWAAEQRVEYKYKALAVITLVVSLAKPLVGITFVILAEDKVTARILGLALVEIIAYTGLFALQVKRGKQLYSQKYWKYALAFNIPLIPHYLSQIVLSSSDRIMISKIIGDSEAGIYSLAYSLSSIMQLFNSALMQTLSPWIYKKIKKNEVTDIKPIAYISLLLIALVNLLLILLAPEAVAIFAPKTYHEAIYVIPPVAMSVFFMYSYDLFAKFAFYYEKTQMIMLASCAGAALNVLLNYIFIGQYGYIAAGYTTLACYIIYACAHYIMMNRVCRQYCNGVKPYDGKRLLTISVVFLTLGFILLSTYDHVVVRYGIIVGVMCIAVIFRNKLKKVLQDILSVRKSR